MSYIKILATLTLLMALVMLSGCASKNEVRHYEKMDEKSSIYIKMNSLRESKGEILDFRSDDYDWADYFDTVLRGQLRENGHKLVFDATRADVIARCDYEVGYGLPYGGRLFHLHLVTARWFRLDLIRKRDYKVLGSIYHYRPFFAFRQSRENLDSLLNDLLCGPITKEAARESGPNSRKIPRQP